MSWVRLLTVYWHVKDYKVFIWNIKKLLEFSDTLDETGLGLSWSCVPFMSEYKCFTQPGSEWWFTLASSQYVSHLCTGR